MKRCTSRRTSASSTSRCTTRASCSGRTPVNRPWYPVRMATRTESDSMGPIQVDDTRFWGAQTERSRQNFKFGGEHMPPELIRARALVKKAAAKVNHEHGLLDDKLRGAIDAAASEVIAGSHDGEFPLVVWQTGSGTQTNMNVNEVIAGRATELLGGKRGGKDPEPPSDPVDMSQSTN